MNEKIEAFTNLEKEIEGLSVVRYLKLYQLKCHI